MDPYSDSGELYHLTQQFFSSKYTEIIKLDLENDIIFTSNENKYQAYKLQIRSYLAIGDYKSASSKIESLASLLELSDLQSAEVGSLKLYTEFLSSGKSKSPEFETFIESNSSSSFVTLLGGLYFTILNEHETAVKILEDSEEFENISLLVLINLLSNKTKEVGKILADFRKISQDNITFTLSQSWSDLLSFNDHLKSGYYFYDELSSNENTNSIKNLICLFISNLKLLHFPESQEILNKIEEVQSENPDNTFLKQWKIDLLINKISFSVLQGLESTELVDELKSLDKSCSYLVDLKEKNDLFDSIVEKYTV